MKLKKYLFLLYCFAVYGCSKSDFLNEIPDNSLKIPATLRDCQLILDNDGIMNGTNGVGVVPSISLIGSDDIYIRDIDIPRLQPADIAQYGWSDNPYLGNDIRDWNFPYRAIFYANQVLSLLKKLPNNSNEYSNVKGQALFYRAFMFYNLAQVFAPHYNVSTSKNQPGIPLRLSDDINEKIFRSSLDDTYKQIIADLSSAESLLPDTALYKTRPSKAATCALLARVNLVMGNWDDAFYYANKSLDISNKLMDFNTTPITKFNREVLFCANSINKQRLSVDTNLLNSYSNNDLRKTYYVTVYSGPQYYFVGSYMGDRNANSVFCGIATNEMYLIKAECKVRLGDTEGGINLLNHLLKNRYKPDFIPYNITDQKEGLLTVLNERRKEIPFRELRWTDLRRLNKEGRNISLTRKVNGQIYELLPNSNKYTWPIPASIISFNPGMPQNPR